MNFLQYTCCFYQEDQFSAQPDEFPTKIMNPKPKRKMIRGYYESTIDAADDVNIRLKFTLLLFLMMWIISMISLLLQDDS